MQDVDDEDDVAVPDGVGVADDDADELGVDVAEELGADVADDGGEDELSVGEDVAQAEAEVDEDEAAVTSLVEAASLRVDVAPDRAVLVSVPVDALDALDALLEAVPDVIGIDWAVAFVVAADDDEVDTNERLEVAAPEDDVARDERDALANLETSAPPSALPDPPVLPQPTQTIANVAAATRCAIVVRSITPSPSLPCDQTSVPRGEPSVPRHLSSIPSLGPAPMERGPWTDRSIGATSSNRAGGHPKG